MTAGEIINCPSCHSEMRVCVERGIELDICDRCNGVWLDAGELAKLANEVTDGRCSWSLPTKKDSLSTNLRCPRCSNSSLVHVDMEHYAFHGCRSCDGLFIESGTLDGITSADDEDAQSTTMGCIVDTVSVVEFLGEILTFYFNR